MIYRRIDPQRRGETPPADTALPPIFEKELGQLQSVPAIEAAEPVVTATLDSSF